MTVIEFSSARPVHASVLSPGDAIYLKNFSYPLTYEQAHKDGAAVIWLTPMGELHRAVIPFELLVTKDPSGQ